MLKVASIVIDPKTAKLALISFTGKASELGGVGSGEMTKTVPVSEADKYLSHCENFEKKQGHIIAKGSKNLYDMPAYNLDTKQDYDNRVTLVARIMKGDQLAGFVVALGNGGVKKNFEYNDVVRIAGWFKPTNYVVRTRGDEKYIAGKGMLLEKLPKFNVGDPSKAKKTTKGSGTKNVKDRVKGQKKEVDVAKAKVVGETNVDIMSLFDHLGDESFVIAMGSYQRTTEKKVQIKSGFRPLGVGTVGRAYLNHSKDDMKTNILFKKPGMVGIEGVPGPILVHTMSNRTIIKNGKCHVDKIGIAIDPANEAKVMDYLNSVSGLIKLRPIDDTVMMNNVLMLTGKTSLKFYELDINGIKMMDEARAKKSVLDIMTVAKAVEKMESNALILKAIKPLIKELEAKLPPVNMAKVLPRYAGYGEAAVEKMKENSIDVYSGIYNGVVKKEELSAEEQKIMDEENEKVADDALHIEYSILPNKITKLTAAQLIAGGTGGVLKYVDEEINKAKEIAKKWYEEPDKLSEDDIKNIKTAIVIMKEKIDAEQLKIKDKLWAHKLAMLVLSDYKKVHTQDAKEWEAVATKAKGKKVYSANVGGNVLKLAISDTLSVDKQ